jgi:glycosyltransferase involved in cell wall biosynthesis
MVVAFADNVAGASRKGAAFFKEALKTLDLTPRPWLLVVGNRGLFESFEGSFSIREVGYLSTSDLMRRCYVAADVFVSPTLADNLPVSLIEAAASGTPSVAFQVGGVPDIIRHKETGYLAKYKDSGDLANGIRWVLSNESHRVSMGQRCRELAECEYSLDLEVERYLDLYHSAKMAGHRKAHAPLC